MYNGYRNLTLPIQVLLYYSKSRIILINGSKQIKSMEKHCRLILVIVSVMLLLIILIPKYLLMWGYLDDTFFAFGLSIVCIILTPKSKG